MQLRPYQQEAVEGVLAEWQNGHPYVCLVMPTGAGKTVTFSDVIKKHNGASCAIVHRSELVSQISMALNANGVKHRIETGDSTLIRRVTAMHIKYHGRSFFDPTAQCAVAAVKTLLSRKKKLTNWMNQVTLVIQDEAHHVLADNEWGKACALFPHAKAMLVTATPIRSDGCGLGRHSDGLMDVMVEGPGMRDLIDMGFLTDYKIYAPPTDFDTSNIEVSNSTGDFKQRSMIKAVKESHLTGDVVKHYLQIANGKLGVTFATDVETATEIANKFNEAGVVAEVVSAKTPANVRAEILERFARREIMQLVNVDLFGEGFDLPAIEVISMARPTQSYSLYCQQFGRVLRLLLGDVSAFDMDTNEGRLAAIAASTKPYGIIIDHAGNVARHGLPDRDRVWSLDSRDKRPTAKDPDDDIPLRYCPECTQPYFRTERACPYCGHYPAPADRSRPEFVDGDLHELSPEVLAQMRAKVEEIDNPSHTIDKMKFANAPEAAIRGYQKNAKRRKEIQLALRESIAWYCGYQKEKGMNDSQIQRAFYHNFGVDILTAQTLGKPETLKLADKINHYLGVTYNG